MEEEEAIGASRRSIIGQAEILTPSQVDQNIKSEMVREEIFIFFLPLFFFLDESFPVL